MPTPIENNVAKLQGLKIKVEELPDKSYDWKKWLKNYSEIKGEIIFPKNLKVITEFAFTGCISLIFPNTFPEGVIEIGRRAFYRGYPLPVISLPKSLKMLAEQAFYNCVFERIWIPKECTTVEAVSGTRSPFLGCADLTDIYTDAPSKPGGWGDYFNYTSSSIQATVHYNVTKAEFEALL